MAFTKVVGAGIHTLSNIASHNINSSGIITATKFVGPFDGSSGDFSGNVTVDGNLTVNGTTSTIDTNLIGVDKIEVTTAGTNVAVAVTQNGSGDLVRLYDSASQVVTVDDEGNVGIGSATPEGNLIIHGGADNPGIKLKRNGGGSDIASITWGSNSANFARINYRDAAPHGLQFYSGGTASSNLSMIIRLDGNVGIGSDLPSQKLDVAGNIKATGTITGSSFVGELPISNDGNDRVITATGTTGTLNAESNFTYNGSSCTIKGTTDGVLNLDTTDSRGSFIRFQKDGTTKVWVGSGQGLSLGDLDDLGLMATDNIIMRAGSDEKFRINSTGELISTNGTLRRNVSDSSFTVSGDTASNTGANINLYGASHASLANVFRVRTGSTERLRIDSSGNITAVNTTAGATTGVTLKVGASAASGTNSGTIIINNGGLGNASLQFDYEGNAARAKIYTYRSTNDIIFDTSGNEKYRFKDTGEFHISDRNSANAGEHVFQAGAFGIRMQDTGGYNRWNIERNYGGFQSTPLVHLSAQGRVGINQGTPTANLHVGGAYNETPAIITGGALGYNDVLQCNTANGHRRFTVAGDGTIYGPTSGRKNWFDNGSFDSTHGGRKLNTSMDHGNHHAYGWVTDRFMSRNAVEWSRSTNVPTGKGFSYSTQTNGAGGQIMQAVELPDYGDMGVFEPNSYWCISIWSTASMNNSAAAFGYDLGNTDKTNVTLVDNTTNTYASTGETASGTSTGTFTRYYKVFQMPSSIAATSTSIYFTWGFSAAGYATGWQLERVPTGTSKPSPYEHVHPAVTIARCRRYCFRLENTRLMNGYKRNDTEIYWHVNTPVPYTHMPAGSNQNVSPLGAYAISTGLLTDFQSQLQNPAITSQSMHIFEYSPASSSFLLRGNTSWSSTHAIAPSWEGMEVEFGHGHF